ncbi:MAG: glycosyltransferase family 4 protein [Bacillota bacterium]
MRVGIDCSLVPSERVGVGQYCYNLVESLAKIDAENHYSLYPVFYYIFHPEYKKICFENLNKTFNISYRWIPEKILKLLWKKDMKLFKKEWLLGNVDVVHSTTFAVPELSRKKRLVVTIYDVSFLTHPQYHVQANIEHCYKGTLKALQQSDRIIAISNHTKSDLINYFGAKEEQITVTHLAAANHFFTPPGSIELRTLVEKYNLPNSFILFVGSLEPRKNVRNLIKAYSLLKKDLRRKHKLVIAGGRGWLNSDIKDIIEELKIVEDMIFTGYVSDQDLKGLYSLADIFVYPSFYEGFGLPVLEAMTCGTPVITSNVSCLPEIAGNGAVFVNPQDVEEISLAINRLLEDNSLRGFYKEKGLMRSLDFSWDKCAKETLQIYKSLAKR